MKRIKLLPITMVLIVLLALSAGLSAAQGPAPQGQVGPQATASRSFTYQGQLKKDGSLVNDTCTMVFSLYDAATAGNMTNDPITQTVTVADGLFTTRLNFGFMLGPGAFTGEARWLEIAVQCTGDAALNTLDPRQELTPAPYALSLRPGAHIEGSPLDDVLTVINQGTGDGVYGETESTGGNGVFGYASGTSGDASGVYGRSDAYFGTGVYGSATGPGSTGVYGEGADIGVRGVGPTGVNGETNVSAGYGVHGYSGPETGASYGVFGVTNSTDGWAGYFLSSPGNGVHITSNASKVGLEVAGGTKNAVVATADGARLLYTEESAEVWFTDYGTGNLQDGVATMAIDPVYAQTVNLDEPYLVFLTPQGDCGLYIAAKTSTSFTVRALDGKTCSIAFDYRIVAKRLGFEDTRLGRAPWADNDPNLYPERQPATPSPFGP